MATISARKFFSRTVAHPGGAVSLAALKRIAGWGFTPDSNNVPTSQVSMDSFTENSGSVIPASDAYFGDSEFVRDAAAAGPPVLYQGVLASGGQPFSLEEFCRGVIGDDNVYIYSAAGQDMQIITLGI